MIKVLVVEDSPVAREYLVHIFSSDPGIKVIGTAVNGKEGVEAAGSLRPDVITMDINMPVMDGLEATRRIMETHPVPIVIVSGIWDPKEVDTTFRAIEAGALAVVQRPAGIGHPESEAMKNELLQKVKLMSEVKVVRRWTKCQESKIVYGRRVSGQETKEDGFPYPGEPSGRSSIVPAAEADIKVVALGASTGGPLAIRTILSGLPVEFPVPVLIVQHMASGFIAGMVEWLSESSPLNLQVAEDGEIISGGHVYFAPDGVDMGVVHEDRIRLYRGGPVKTVRPSVSHLFRSVAELYGGKSAAVLLTGMGSDGAAELKLLKEKGAVTIVQDRESSVIYGMPGVAKELGAAVYELPPEKVASALINIAGQSRRERS